MFVDALISQRDVFAKKTVAFFKKSRSSITCRSSRRKRCSSSSCELILPLPGNAATPRSACCRRDRFRAFLAQANCLELVLGCEALPLTLGRSLGRFSCH